MQFRCRAAPSEFPRRHVGESIVVAEGFTLLGYSLPMAAILSAGMLVGVIARGRATQDALVPVEQLSADEEAKLRAAMQSLDESESPDW